MNAILQLPSTQTQYETLADLVTALGDVPLSRIRMKPAPGTATEADVIALSERADKILCELIDGVLVEKAMGSYESQLSILLSTELMLWIRTGRWGFLTGEQGQVRIPTGRIRVPDLSFYRRDRQPGGRRPQGVIWEAAPDLVVEILSESNRPGEMQSKREDYFAAGVRLLWEIDPVARTVMVSASVTESIVLTEADFLTSDAVLPGFRLSIVTLFADGE